ncbi:MAG: hydroxymethylglutaryl-CoA lyase [Acidobacteria bacterium]|nr:hydroxymethylglutaryl-CoA lyase [Acidobacteriota bacterium]MBU4307559.1 hydroxymethylglutaryl-CoA lyase [Acidobacteriota bacterium]MCG2811062.1 hydroxymethylglutaryl-CoA lyase [Candidatus Aminicenantes bacterium]
MSEVKIHEVGLRDGLQIEKQIVPLEKKVEWVEGLLASGSDMIQLGSFVNPEKVPQMADSDKLFSHFTQAGKKPSGAIFSGLVLNEKGLERGLACGVDMFCMGVSASDTHSRKNTGKSTEEAVGQIIAMAQAAMKAQKRIQVSIQSAFGCGFEGAIPQERIFSIVDRYLAAGIRNISLADTAGHAYPQQVESLYAEILQRDSQVELACHFHNTYGLGLANCYAALKAGVKYFEAALGGLGGCPFTKVAAGNVCTEDLVHSLQRQDMVLDINLDKLMETARDVGSFFNRDLPGSILKAGSLINFKKA